jgi:hypothetical protein
MKKAFKFVYMLSTKITYYKKKGLPVSRLSLKFTSNAKSLSSFSGLKIFDDLIEKFALRSLLGSFLPRKLRDRGFGSWEKFFAGLIGFIAGAECLDDFDFYAQDPLFHHLTSSPSAPTMGKFLRSFTPRKIQQIKNVLPQISLKIRANIDPHLYQIVFSMDSTDHQQYGRKSEGVEYGYRKILCLNSQNLFDDRGLCYGFHLRRGNTYSGEDAVEMIQQAFSQVPKTTRKYFRADSAYSNLHVYNILLNHNCRFTICLKENVWGSLLEKYGSKIKWNKTNLHFFDSDKCEIGSCLYPLKGLAGRGFLRVVMIRTKNKKPRDEDKYSYHYYAVVTDMSSSEMGDEQILKFYRKRSQVENYIKDLKNGMDFHHFPCMKLGANNVWGLIGIIAYNLMRYASFMISPRGCFVQTTRKKIVTIAGEVIKHARSIEIRMMNFFYKEVTRIKSMMNKFVLTVDVSRLRPLLE